MLRYRRLPELERIRDVGHRPLVAGDELEDVAPAGFRDRVERIGRRRSAGHVPFIYSYMGICQAPDQRADLADVPGGE